MKHKTKIYTTVTMAFLTLSIILAAIPMASAAGAITLNPTTQTTGGSVTVDGTGFGATKAVGIGIGAEVTVSAEVHPITNLVTTPDGDGYYGPFGGTTVHYPIKPGSVYIFYDVDGTTSDYTDNGDGTLTSSSTYAINPYVNYVNGSFGRKSTADWSGFTAPVAYINYTYYTYNVTPAAGVTTLGSGAFTASITVPTVTDGNYVVTAVDTAGNKATQTLNVVPEGLTIGVMLTLSTIAVIVSTRYFGKTRIKRQSRVNL
jgi:hypothetical protein